MPDGLLNLVRTTGSTFPHSLPSQAQWPNRYNDPKMEFEMDDSSLHKSAQVSAAIFNLSP